MAHWRALVYAPKHPSDSIPLRSHDWPSLWLGNDLFRSLRIARVQPDRARIGGHLHDDGRRPPEEERLCRAAKRAALRSSRPSADTVSARWQILHRLDRV